MKVLDRCILKDPRHWSTVQAFEGATNVRITNNIIGPAGVGCDEAQFRWADGISYACEDGLVAGNLVKDATDGAIGGCLPLSFERANHQDTFIMQSCSPRLGRW